MNNKKIFITGGNGFLGSALVRLFISKGCKVFVASRNDNNLIDVRNNIEFVTLNETCYGELKEKLIKFSPEYVIHCAWDGGNSHSNVHDANQFNKNISMSINLLEIINSLNTKPTFVGIGSFAEYGNITKQVTEEDVESPTNFYGLSKLTVNKLSKIFCDRNNINWTWIRPCYVYGPNDVSTRIIPAVLNCLLNNKSVTLDSCDVTVDYLHIYDFCSAVYHITNKNLHGIYNVCSGKEYSLRNIIELLYTLTSQQNTPVFGSERYRTDSPTYVCGANNKLKLSGWVHNYELQDGIIDTINFHKNQRSIDDV